LWCTCEEHASAPLKAADRQGKTLLYRGGYYYDVVSAHYKIAEAANYLGDLETKSVSDYKTYAAKLDKAAVDYHEEFAVQALLLVTHNLLAARKLCFHRASEMFSIHNFNKKTAQGQRHKCQALAPLLRSIVPLSSESMEKALVRGLFRSVLLSYMALPECTYDAYRGARALQIAYDEASSRGESASAARISGGQSAIACPHQSWITDMQDAGSAIIVLYNGATVTGARQAHFTDRLSPASRQQPQERALGRHS